MGQQASNVDPVSGLPTGATLPMAQGTLPKGADGRSIPIMQGFRHEDATGGPVGAVGNLVAPLTLQGPAATKIVIPPGATVMRIRTRDKILYGAGANFNVDPGPQVGALPPAIPPGQGRCFLNGTQDEQVTDDGWRELPVAGMAAIYFQAMGARAVLWFEFLVLSNL